MITIERSGQAANGKFTEAIAFATTIRDYLSENHGADISVHRQIGGNPFKIVWISRFENMAAQEKFMADIMADEKYLAHLVAAGDLFTEGSLSDTMLTSL